MSTLVLKHTSEVGTEKQLESIYLLKTLFNNFLNEHDVKENSKKTYEHSFNGFLRFVQNNNVNELNKKTLLDFKSYLTLNYSPYTANLYLGVIKQLFKYLHDTGLIKVNNVASIKRIKEPKGFKKDSLTVADVKALLTSVDRSVITGKRDYAILLLMITTGLRTKEIVEACMGDVRQVSGQYVLYVQGKGRDSKDDYVVLNEGALKAIREYKKELGKADDSAPLFKSFSNRNTSGKVTTKTISKMVKDRLASIGIEDERITAHSLRHTAVTLSLLAGATPQETQAMARHSDINTTLIYAHNIDRIGNAPENKILDFINNG